MGGNDVSKMEKVYNLKDTTFKFVDREDELDFFYEGFDSPRAEMSCGHAVTPMSLTNWCCKLLDEGKNRFVCGMTGCNKEWSYEEVCKMALLTPEEKEYFETTMKFIADRERLKNTKLKEEHTMVAQGDVIVPLRSSGVSHRPVVQVKVKSYDGLELPVDLAESEDDMKILTLRQFKDKIQRLPGNPAQMTSETTLTYAGKRLDSDSKTLGEYGLKPKALIQMVVTVHGGFRDRDTTITSSS
ncbi:hypothetical protein FQA47_019858 [Oryzias melastigma]|uniref:Ubiquitin-like domain-containing protein n=1 Tax=Oryzias melastigma TaxID=30732 RepID=A0A834CCV3_ORYME|nr:hypothetical protein FQA47_019858 [Oryzias melastigma]